MSLPTRLFIGSSFSAFFAVRGHDKLTGLVSNESTSTFEVLRVYLLARASFSDEEIDFVRTMFIPTTLRSGEFLQRAGTVAKYAAFVLHRGRDRPSPVWRVPVAGRTPVKVVEGVVLGAFDVVERGVYYIDRLSGEGGSFFTDRPGRETRLQFFDFTTRQSTTVARNLGVVGPGLSASRDGRTIFYSRVDSAVDELMLVENFR